MFPTHSLLSRRALLQQATCGFGSLALASLAGESRAAEDPLAPKTPHFAPRAKRVIFLFMTGGPTHVDTFDYKPKLNADAAAGKTYSAPDLLRKGGSQSLPLLASPWKFRQHGQSGQWISDLFPHLARQADDLCLINSMWTDLPNHPQAHLLMHTGEFRFPRPSLGSWLLYGLGNERKDLPGFVILSPPTGAGRGTALYSNGFLPAVYQGLKLGNQPRLANAATGNLEAKRRELELIQALNQDALASNHQEESLEAVVRSFETGFRMQQSMPDLLDISGETRQTQEAYGKSDFGRQCLVARRLAEAGVRFIEVCKGDWDTHNNIEGSVPGLCEAIDQPIAALLVDLKQRGLLADTLVVWGGEFGRTPTAQGRGRDHNNLGFSFWLAGAGIRAGFRYGATDEYGMRAAENPVHVRDLHATLLHLLGLDHQRLTYRYSGRNYSLTDVHDARVVEEILA